MIRRALVTGAAKRIGRAMALALARRGFDVAVHYHGSDAAAEATLAMIRAEGATGVALKADLLDHDATDALVPRAVEALGGPLGVLVNNASIFEHDSLGSITDESWTRGIDSNLRAPVFLTQAFAAGMPEPQPDLHGEPVAQGLVVNMLDQRVRKLTPAFTSYTLAKMGLYAFTETAARALAPRIRVNAIGPGPTVKNPRQSDAHFSAQRQATILERGSNPEDICGALGYFLDAPGVTGQVILTDGGQHLVWKTPDVGIVE